MYSKQSAKEDNSIGDLYTTGIVKKLIYFGFYSMGVAKEVNELYFSYPSSLA